MTTPTPLTPRYQVVLHTDLVHGLNPVWATLDEHGRMLAIGVDDPLYHSESARAFFAKRGIELIDREPTAEDIGALKAFLAHQS
jgi:hypothetical protein